MSRFGMDYNNSSGGGDMNNGNTMSSPGGYNNSGGGMDSPTPTKARKSREEQTLIPCTIRMILAGSSSSGDGEGRMFPDGREMDKVKIVGAVRSVERNSTNYNYSIEDGTGLIDVKCWINDNDSVALAEIREQSAQDHVYVRIVGQVKDYEGSLTIVGDNVRKIQSGNELTCHMLEAIYSSQTYKKGSQIVGAPSLQYGSSSAPQANMSTNSPLKQQTTQFGSSSGGGSSGIQQELMDYITRANSETGADIKDFLRDMGGKYNLPQIRSTVDELASEGLIYSTTDEDKYTLV